MKTDVLLYLILLVPSYFNTSFKFKQDRTGRDGRKYLLSFEAIAKITDTYFRTEEMTHNDTDDTKCHQRHQTTLEGVNSDISVIIPERASDQKEVIHFPCFVCGSEPCLGFAKKGGAPLCAACLNRQDEEVIE